MMLGSLEMEKGPCRADLRLARKHFETAPEAGPGPGVERPDRPPR